MSVKESQSNFSWSVQKPGDSVSLAHLHPNVVKDRADSIDHQVTFHLADEFVIRMRDARVVPDRIESIYHRGETTKDTADVLVLGSKVLE